MSFKKFPVAQNDATCDGKLPQVIFLCPRWFPFVGLHSEHIHKSVALQGDYDQDVATQAASGVEPCAPTAQSDGHKH